MKMNKADYEELAQKMEELQDELDCANRLLDGSNGVNLPDFLSHRSSLIEDIREIAEELISNGYDPSKIRNADCLLSL